MGLLLPHISYGEKKTNGEREGFDSIIAFKQLVNFIFIIFKHLISI